MNKSISIWQFCGFALTSLGGTILHFLYEWSGSSILAAPFSGVNESTCEHMKLLFWPTFVFAVVQSFFFKERKDFWCIKLKGTLVGLLLIPTLFYTYNGVVGKSSDYVNVAIFFISAAILYFYETKLFKRGEKSCVNPNFAFFALCVIALFFVTFTFITPKIGIFKDPVDGSYGINS